MYKVIICDIQSSRYIKNRIEVQKKLLKILAQCNTKFKKWIICDFKITAGDEWEGLLKLDSKEKYILDYFKNNLPSNIKFYVGIGIGDLSINDFTMDVNLLDGEAFIKARESLNYNKKYNNIYY